MTTGYADCGSRNTVDLLLAIAGARNVRRVEFQTELEANAYYAEWWQNSRNYNFNQPLNFERA